MTNIEGYEAALQDIRSSFSAVRQVVRTALLSSPEDLEFQDGISLLSLKNEVLLSYIHSVVLMSCHRIQGHSLLDRDPPSQGFASLDRDPRGSDAGDLVDHAIEARAILDKTKALEARMKYQIEKLVRLAESSTAVEADIGEDPLAFRPNVQNLVAPNSSNNNTSRNSDGDDDASYSNDGIYRPPKLAPVPYADPSASSSSAKKQRAAPIASTLSSLAHLDPSMPHSESTSGLGGGSGTQKASVVKQRLDEMTRFEEENMTRLMMKKKDANRRKRDEGDIALGGMGGGRARGGGLEEEFDDILRSVGRSRSGKVGDGYEELRTKGRKADSFSRSRVRKADDEGLESGGRERKKGRFDKDVKNLKRKGSRK